MTSVILAGNGISANILYAYLSRDTRYKVLGVTADDEHLAKGGVEELVVVGLSRLRETFPPHVCRVIMAVGYSDLNRGRESMFCRVFRASPRRRVCDTAGRRHRALCTGGDKHGGVV
jgi:FlaA1/EpsC-like NDP-sugar epimerase